MSARRRAGFGPLSARRRRAGHWPAPASSETAFPGALADGPPAGAAEGAERDGRRDGGGRGRARGAAAAGSARAARGPDVAGMRRAVADFLRASGVPLSAADAARTPDRVAQAWAQDLLRGYALDPVAELTSDPVPAGGGLVVLRGVEFHSTCVHHLLPFYGRAHVAYLPGRRLAGLSKIARVVDILARRLQVQEEMTDAIVATLERALRPAGAACVIEAEHMCVACRGIRKSGVKVVTSRFSGRLARGRGRAEALEAFSGAKARRR